MPNSFGNCPTSINIEINIVLDFDCNNSSSNKNNYFFDNYGFLFNDIHHKNN